MKTKALAHRFVDTIPDQVEEGMIYISLLYCTAIHRCACGCGNEVATPISPRDWQLIFDGETISLEPSIGNWNFPCRSHYFITKGKVRHLSLWSDKEIERGQKKEEKQRKRACKKKKWWNWL